MMGHEIPLLPTKSSKHIIVYTPGVWDLLHVGHVTFLKKAKALGTWLVVGVASDEAVRKDKGRYPVIPSDQRVEMLRAIRFVDDVAEYPELCFLDHLNKYRPKFLAVGEYWGDKERHLAAEDWMAKHNGIMLRLNYTPDVSTTSIRMKIIREG